MSKLPWVIVGVLVVAAFAVTLVVTAGGGDPKPVATPRKPTYDLSSPEAAAASFARAARTKSGDTLLKLACVDHPVCVREHAAGLSEERLAEERDTIREGVYELAEHLKGVEFAAAVDGQQPGTKDVPYRTPAMTSDGALTFVKSGGDWLYLLPAGG